MTRESIIRLDGTDLDDRAAVLLVYRLSTRIEVVVTEEHGPDAVVVISREQAKELTRKLLAELDGEER